VVGKEIKSIFGRSIYERNEEDIKEEINKRKKIEKKYLCCGSPITHAVLLAPQQPS
jgi:hypothetical protein